MEKKSNWQVENIGIDIVPEKERTGNSLQLFWVWSAANIGILGIVYGVIVVSFGLSFIQSILAIIIGIASFALVGMISFAGQTGRTSTLTLSRAIFGFKGNIAPTVFSWITLMGWEAVNIITGTLTLVALWQAMGIETGTLSISISLILFGGLTVIVSLLGQNTVLWLQSWCTRIFGTLTLVVVVYIVVNANWDLILNLPNGSWLNAFIPAVAFVAAGTGITWAIAGADYSRYQADSVSKKSIFTAVVSGAGIPLFLLISTGVLISAQLPNLANEENPIVVIGQVLPNWMVIPYLMTATAGIVTIAVLSLYSASLNLLTIGIKVKQFFAVTVDSVIVLSIAIYVLFISRDFLGPFISFLTFCGAFLSPWAAIFILDYFLNRYKNGYEYEKLYNPAYSVNYSALFCWILGLLSGLLVTKTGFIDGFLAIGIFEDTSLGVFLSFFVSFICYFVVCKLGCVK